MSSQQRGKQKQTPRLGRAWWGTEKARWFGWGNCTYQRTCPPPPRPMMILDWSKRVWCCGRSGAELRCVWRYWGPRQSHSHRAHGARCPVRATGTPQEPRSWFDGRVTEVFRAKWVFKCCMGNISIWKACFWQRCRCCHDSPMVFGRSEDADINIIPYLPW